MATPEPDDIRSLLALFPLLMLFFALEPRLSRERTVRSAAQSFIVGSGLTLSAVGALGCLAVIAFPVLVEGGGRVLLIFAFVTGLLAAISASALTWRRLATAQEEERR